MVDQDFIEPKVTNQHPMPIIRKKKAPNANRVVQKKMTVYSNSQKIQSNCNLTPWLLSLQ
jgi:hypothetical protein